MVIIKLSVLYLLSKKRFVRIFLGSFFVVLLLIAFMPAWANQEIIQKTEFGRLNLDDLKSNDPTLKPESKKELTIPIPSPFTSNQVHFLLKKVHIKGVKAIPIHKLQAVAKAKLGKKITFLDLQNMADAMSAIYRKFGFVLSQVIIPVQDIQDGTVTFQAIEGSIGKILIDDNHLPINIERLKNYTHVLSKEHPLKITTLERALLLANELPGIEVKSYLMPSKTKTGAADLTLRVEQRKAYESFLMYDNKVDKAYGSTQLTAGLCYNHPNLSDKTQLIGRISNQKSLKLLYAAHNHFTSFSGAFITIEAQYVDAKPNLNRLTWVPTAGTTATTNLMFSYPIIKSRIASLLFSAAIDTSDTRARGGRNFADHLRSLRLSVESNFLDSLRGSNTFHLKLSKGLKVLGASNTSSSSSNSFSTFSRASGKSNYTKLNFEFARLQYFLNPLSILFNIEAQYSFNSLLAAEEFSFGGYHFGRGYPNSSFLGDQGVVGKLESRYDFQPNKRWLEKLQPYLFYDMGYIEDKSATKLRESGTPSTIPYTTATSGGIGSRLFINKNLFAQLEIAKPLSKKNEDGNKKAVIIFSIHGDL